MGCTYVHTYITYPKFSPWDDRMLNVITNKYKICITSTIQIGPILRAFHISIQMLHYIKLHSILNIRNSSTEETQSVSMYLLKPTLNFDYS